MDKSGVILLTFIFGGGLLFFVWLRDLLPEDLMFKRFLSEDGNLMLQALEKQAARPQGVREKNPRTYSPLVDEFLDPFVGYAGYVDRNVLRHAKWRLERTEEKRAALATAREAAGKILMGGEEDK